MRLQIMRWFALCPWAGRQGFAGSLCERKKLHLGKYPSLNQAITYGFRRGRRTFKVYFKDVSHFLAASRSPKLREVKFSFSTSLTNCSTDICVKRSLLSTTANLFNPIAKPFTMIFSFVHACDSGTTGKYNSRESLSVFLGLYLCMASR